MSRLKVLLFAAALSACADDVSFPEHPPRRIDRGLTAASSPVDVPRLIELAGPGARDCGTARDKTTADRVYRCAATELEHRRSFYCRFEPRASITDRSPTPAGVVWGMRAAFFSRDGKVYRAEIDERGKPVEWLIPLNGTPLFIGPGMTTPSPATTPSQIRGEYGGRVLIEAVVRADGIVEKARVLIPVASEEMTAAALRLVTDERFEPSRLFGRPLSVYYNFSVEVRANAVRFTPTLPGAVSN